MANLFSSISNLFVANSKTKIEKSEAELALERANKLIAEKTQQAKEFAENKVKLEKEIELKRQQASEELAKQAQISKLMHKAAKAVEEAHTELEVKRTEFFIAAEKAANEAAEIELSLTQAKQANKERVKDFDAWLNQFDEKKTNVKQPKVEPTQSND